MRSLYRVSTLLSAIIGVIESVYLSVRPTIMQFSQNGSPNTLVFVDVKMLHKFEGCHPQPDDFLQVP